MAEIISGDYVSPRTRGRSKYPWNDWLDGQRRRLRRGQDYFGQTLNFTRAIRVKAKEKGCRTVQITIEDDNTIVIRAIRDLRTIARKRSGRSKKKK